MCPNITLADFCNKKMILGVSVLFLFVSSWAQDTLIILDSKSVEINSIRLVSKFPAENGEDVKSIFNRIGEFFFGRDQKVYLSKPISIFAESPNTFWVLDQGVGSLVKVNEHVGEIPQSFEKKYSSLVGICASDHQELLFTDSRLNKIFKIGLQDDELSEFRVSADLNQPTGIAYSILNDEIWVVETAAHCITVLNRNGEIVRQIGKRGEGPGEFNFPTFIWIDKSGVVYIVDSMNFRIQILSNSGEFISAFGQIGDASGYFARPKGIATDSNDNIYIVDALFHAVQIFDKKGNFLYHFGMHGRDDGQFWMPSGIFIDDSDYIYVADSYNSRIQVFQLITSNK